MIFKWFHNRKHKHSPKCVCGYRMVFTEETLGVVYWGCIRKKCNWESYTSANGKLHWYRR